jgi:hypothetical protein
MLFSPFVGHIRIAFPHVQTVVPETQFLLHKALSGQPTNLCEHAVSFRPQNVILSVSGLGFCCWYIYIFIEREV